MIEKLSNAIQAKASGKNIAVAIAVYGVFAAALKVAGDAIELRSGGNSVLDLQHYFTAERAYALLDSYGEEGRRIYAYAELVDLVYPLAYATMFALVIAFTWKRILPPGSRLLRLCVLPVAAACVDYLENIGIFTLLATYPARLYGVATATGVFNACKWALAVCSIALAAAGVLGWIAKALIGQRR
jgi:hypothetical protein